MATLADLMAWRDNLLAARAKGLKRVSHNGRDVVYQDDEAMARAIADLERRINEASQPRARGPIRVTTSKGV